MGYACKFDALNAGDGYALPVKLDLNPSPQFSSYLILTSWRGAHLQANRGSRAV